MNHERKLECYDIKNDEKFRYLFWCWTYIIIWETNENIFNIISKYITIISCVFSMGGSYDKIEHGINLD